MSEDTNAAMLADADREAQELLSRRQAERDLVSEARRHVAELETELGAAKQEAEAERKRRADHERGLQAHIESTEKKRAKAERELEQARQRLLEAEQRIKDTQDAVAESREAGQGERKRQAEMERGLEAQLGLAREALSERQVKHGETETEISALQKRLDEARAAAEQQLARAQGTLASLGGGAAERTAARREPGAGPVIRDDKVSLSQLLTRRVKRGEHAFIDTPGSCAVCQATIQAKNDAELAANGWIVRGDVGLCPHCQQDRWRLPEGATVPYRRFSERQPSA